MRPIESGKETTLDREQFPDVSVIGAQEHCAESERRDGAELDFMEYSYMG